MQAKRLATVALSLTAMLLTAGSALAGGSTDPIEPVPGPSTSGKGATNYSIQTSGGAQHGFTGSDPCDDALEMWVTAYGNDWMWGMLVVNHTGLGARTGIQNGKAMRSAGTTWNSNGCGGGAGYTIGDAAYDGGYIDDSDACDDFPCGTIE